MRKGNHGFLLKLFLKISNGTAASTAFARVMFTEAGRKDRDKVISQLEEYCGLDTMGMMEIVGRLIELVGASTPSPMILWSPS